MKLDLIRTNGPKLKLKKSPNPICIECKAYLNYYDGYSKEGEPMNRSKAEVYEWACEKCGAHYEETVK